MQVLTVMPQANLGGGAETMFLNFLNGLREVRPEWKCLVIFLRPGPFVKVVEDAGFPVTAVLDVRLRNPASCLNSLSRIVREIKKQRVDVIFSWMAYGHLFGGIVAFLTGTPALWYQIAFARGWLDALATLVPCRLILSVSQHIGLKQQKLWPKRRVKTVWPGIEQKLFLNSGGLPRATLRIRLGLQQEGPLAVIVGRLQRWKGIHAAIAAMALVIRKLPEAKLAIVGGSHWAEPSYPLELDAMIRDLGITDRVIMAGPQQNIEDWMSAGDVVLHASQEEPFGIVVIEAMACGRPVITGNDGGVIEAIRQGLEGLHVRFEDHQGLADAMIYLFTDHKAADRMGLAGLERARHFTRRRYAEEICSSLEQHVLNKN